MREVFCEKCHKEFNYKEDMLVGYGVYGLGFTICPYCKEITYLPFEMIRLNKNNVRFPIHYNRISRDEPGVKKISNEEIDEMVKECIDFLRNNKNEDYCVKRIGDVLINVNKIEQDQEYFVSVSKEHYDTIIPYNKLVFDIKAKNFEKDYSF